MARLTTPIGIAWTIIQRVITFSSDSPHCNRLRTSNKNSNAPATFSQRLHVINLSTTVFPSALVAQSSYFWPCLCKVHWNVEKWGESREIHYQMVFTRVHETVLITKNDARCVINLDWIHRKKLRRQTRVAWFVELLACDARRRTIPSRRRHLKRRWWYTS